MKEKQINELRKIVDCGMHDILQTTFFKTLKTKNNPFDFYHFWSQLRHVAYHFAEILNIGKQRFQDSLQDFHSAHYEEERDHAEMFRNWIKDDMKMSDPVDVLPTMPTELFVSFMYRVASACSGQDKIVLINGVAEQFAHTMYVPCVERFRELDFPNLTYWDLHAELDEEHSNIWHLLEGWTEQEFVELKNLVHIEIEIIKSMLTDWA